MKHSIFAIILPASRDQVFRALFHYGQSFVICLISAAADDTYDAVLYFGGVKFPDDKRATKIEENLTYFKN